MRYVLLLLAGLLAALACSTPSQNSDFSAATADAAQPEVRYYVINDM
jgi:hypothetical protein